MSKARPRFARNGRTYMPERYRAWRHQAEDALKGHWLAFELPTVCHATASLDFYGPARFDLDNLVGAVLDAGLPNKSTGWRGCWRDDRVSVFSEICARWHKSSQQRTEILLSVDAWCDS